MVDSIRNLASESEERRRSILALRINSIIRLPEEKRRAELEGLMDILGEFSEKERVTVYKTLSGIIQELGMEKIEVLMGTMKIVASKWPLKRKLAEKKAISEATKDFSFLERTAIRAYFNKLF